MTAPESDRRLAYTGLLRGVDPDAVEVWDGRSLVQPEVDVVIVRLVGRDVAIALEGTLEDVAAIVGALARKLSIVTQNRVASNHVQGTGPDSFDCPEVAPGDEDPEEKAAADAREGQYTAWEIIEGL